MLLGWRSCWPVCRRKCPAQRSTGSAARVWTPLRSLRGPSSPARPIFFFSSRIRHTRSLRDWSSDVCSSDLANVDETGWKEAGKRRWLWVMVSALATCFAVATSRNGPALRHLLGAAYGGIVGSDRHRPYLALPPARHQLCWSHLVRNFQALVDRGGRLGVWGADFLALSHLVFRLWHLFREGTLDRALLQAALAPIQQAMHDLLVQGARR